jgi:hypothetical protein
VLSRCPQASCWQTTATANIPCAASPRRTPELPKPILDYSCQEEGMVGLGCGARSYTRNVHYASRYGVSRKATESIIADYVAAEAL